MNDYKELIEMLRHQVINDDDASEIADAIEQLVSDYEILAKMYAKVNEDLCVRTKERDAAVGQLEAAGFCDYCKHRDIEKQHCNKRGKCYWEWRGVQEDNDEID